MKDGKRIKIHSALISPFPKTTIDIKCLEGYVSPILITIEGKPKGNASQFFSL
jgi:hypothetical protein